MTGTECPMSNAERPISNVEGKAEKGGKKFEYLNPKSETNPNIEVRNTRQRLMSNPPQADKYRILRQAQDRPFGKLRAGAE